MRLSLKERKFTFLPTFSLPLSSSLLKVPNDTAGALNVQMKSVLKMVSCWSPDHAQAVYILYLILNTKWTISCNIQCELNSQVTRLECNHFMDDLDGCKAKS